MVTDAVKISEEVEMPWDAGKGFAPMDKCGDDGTLVGVYVDRMESIESE